MDTLLMPSIKGYLIGEVALEQLQNQLIDITWGDQNQIPQDTAVLAKNIQLCIAEFTGQHISELSLKSAIRDVAGIKLFVVDAPVSSSPISRWGSAATTQKHSMAFA